MNQAHVALRSTRVLRTGLAYATVVLLVGSVALNVLQANRLKELVEPRPGVQPLLGTTAPPLHVKALDGRPVEIRFDERPTILYYFSPTCGWCEKNWLNIKALVAGTQGRYRFVGLSTSLDVEAFLRERRLSFEVYAGLSPEVARAFQFGATPQTVVVSETGRVEHVWVGAYTPRQQQVVETTLGVVLPGLQVSAGRR